MNLPITPKSHIFVHFATKEDLIEFSNLIEQRISHNTNCIWYPQLTIEEYNKLFNNEFKT